MIDSTNKTSVCKQPLEEVSTATWQENEAYQNTWMEGRYYQPKTCSYRFFSPEEICEHFQNKRVFFYGDSLIRDIWLVWAEYATKTEDIVLDKTQQDSVNCYGKDKFMNTRICHNLISTHQLHNSVCGITELWFAGFRNFSSADEMLQFSERKVMENNEKGDYLIIGVGLHEISKSTAWFISYLKEVIPKLKQDFKNILWLTVHWNNINMIPPQYRQAQASDAILEHNNAVIRVLEEQKVPVFDTFEITRNQNATGDGVHFSRWINLMKLQIIMNYYFNSENERE